MPTIVGEWSLAVTDCQKYLHGGYATHYVAPGELKWKNPNKFQNNLQKVIQKFNDTLDSNFCLSKTSKVSWAGIIQLITAVISYMPINRTA